MRAVRGEKLMGANYKASRPSLELYAVAKRGAPAGVRRMQIASLSDEI
jgi:hypothetical protein